MKRLVVICFSIAVLLSPGRAVAASLTEYALLQKLMAVVVQAALQPCTYLEEIDLAVLNARLKSQGFAGEQLANFTAEAGAFQVLCSVGRADLGPEISPEIRAEIPCAFLESVNVWEEFMEIYNEDGVDAALDWYYLHQDRLEACELP